MEPFFKHYRIQARIFDPFGKMVYKHEPEIRNHHVKPLYGMIKGNHIYTLNHDIKSLEQKQDKEHDKQLHIILFDLVIQVNYVSSFLYL